VRSGPFEHHVLDDTLDPREWLAEIDGVVSGNNPEDDVLLTKLELTDLPHVMNRDMDLEMAMQESHENGINAAVRGLESDTTETSSGAVADDHRPDRREDQ